jgi:hypothetical protein
MIRIFITKLLFVLTYTIYAQTSIPFAVHSKTSHVLYSNCSNSIAINLLPCTSSFSIKSIKFTINNATIKIDSMSNNTFFLTIVPNESSSDLVLRIYDDSSIVGTETFQVKNLPAPEIHLTIAGKDIDSKNGLYGLSNKIDIEAVMNKDVHNITSINAQYKVTDFEMTFVKAGKVLEKIQIKSNFVDLKQIKNIEQTEYIIISINEVNIITLEGNLKKIRCGTTIITLPVIK